MAVAHHTTKEEARRIIERRLDQLRAQYGGMASDIQESWNGNVFTFSVKARGFTGSGTLEVTDSEVIIDGKLPLIAKPFEPRIRSTIDREAAALFPA
jgi:hypothetical protein